jgi:hypothetical protein
MKSLVLALCISLIGQAAFAQANQVIKAAEGIKALETLLSAPKSADAIMGLKNLAGASGRTVAEINRMSKSPAELENLMKGLDQESLRILAYYGKTVSNELAAAEGAQEANNLLHAKTAKTEVTFDNSATKFKLPVTPNKDALNWKVFVNDKNAEVVASAPAELQGLYNKNLDVLVETELKFQEAYGVNADGSHHVLATDAKVLCNKMSDAKALEVKIDGEEAALNAIKGKELPASIDDGVAVLAKEEVKGLQKSFDKNLDVELSTKDAAERLEKAYDPNGACEFGSKKLYSAVKAIKVAA